MSSLFDSLTGSAILDPWMLLLALLVPFALFVRRMRGSPAVRFAPGGFLQPTPGPAHPPDSANRSGMHTAPGELPRSWRVRFLWLPQALRVAGLLLVVLALARPVHRTQLPFKAEGIDILLCLDTSSSMTANDMDRARTRLDVARDAAKRFIARRPDDRIGLVCFARYPDLRCPPTLDHDALGRLLSGVTTVTSDGPEDATGIGTALTRAAQVLQNSTAKSRVMILLTDGEENVATDKTPDEIAPLHAAQLCEELGLRVYTIAAGIGSPDRSGSWVDIDTSQVERLAEMTGGRFYKARDAGAVDGVYANINDLEKTEIDKPRYKIEEKFLPFLIAALVLLLASGLLRSLVMEVLP